MLALRADDTSLLTSLATLKLVKASKKTYHCFSIGKVTPRAEGFRDRAFQVQFKRTLAVRMVYLECLQII